MKATTVLLFVVVLICVAQANNFVAKPAVENFLDDFIAQCQVYISQAYNAVMGKINDVQNTVGVYVFCNAAAAA